MILVKTAISTYERIEKDLRDVCPWVKLIHVMTDSNLKLLGFTDIAPCMFVMDIDNDQYMDMLDQIMELEIDAFGSGEEPQEDDPAYIKYEKYGWLWDLFYSANKEEISEARFYQLMQEEARSA